MKCPIFISRKFLTFWLLLLVVLVENAMPATDYRFDTWQTDDGLPQGTVTSIVQTPDGYLWLGTQNGLVRFDGVSFRVFNEDNTPAIKNNRIVQLFVDHAGTLWIGTEQGGLLELQDGQFSSYEMPGKGTAFNYARTFSDDAEGNLWVVTCEWQLLKFQKGRFEVVSTDEASEGIPAALAHDRVGQIWVNTERELLSFENGKLKTAWSEPNAGNFNIELGTSRNGGVWVAANNRLRRYDAGNWVADLGAFAWTNSPIYDLYEDSQNRVWVATMGSGLFRYSPDGTVLHLTTKDGLPSDFVRCVIEDTEGNMWVGMESGGLSRMRLAAFQSLDARQGLSSDQVTSISESTNADFWIAMDGEGLDYLSKDGRIEHFDASQGLMNGHVWSVLEDHQGTVWAGTWDGLFKRQEDRFINLSDGVKIARQVFAIFEDRQHNIWLGQQGLGALTRLSADEQTLVTIPGTTSSLDVRAMAQDSQDGFWVGTENEGLYRLQNGCWTRFGKEDGLASESIWSLRADNDGTIWIGTCGGGLSRWRNGKITTWTEKNGLANDVVCQILEDDKNNLWIGSYGGVFQISKQELDESSNNSHSIECISYDKSDGLPSIECVGGFQPSGHCSRDGRLWFPTVKGLAIVNPDKITRNLLPPPVVIEDLSADGASLWPGRDGLNANPPGGGLSVPPGKQRLEFRYTALSLTASEKVRFKYRLSGLENQWQEAGGKRTAVYGRILPGNYQFEVIACNNDGVWNRQGASLAITVLPHFWETRWFAVLVVMITLGSVGGSVRYVVKQKLQRRIEHIERQRAIEAERGRIANDIHDDLGSGLTEIVILSQLVKNAKISSETVQADAFKINNKARALTQSLDEIVWAMNLQNDTLDDFVTYACNYAQDYLQSAGIRCRLVVPANLPHVPLTADIRHNLFMALKEALNNIVKHARASEVRIQIEVEPQKFTLTINDNGKGLCLDPKANGDADGGTGNTTEGSSKDGLINMRKRLENINGQLRLQSESNQGTRVEMIIPLPSP
jgi:ligand-binding sensor domain-containing protein/signal transduction histidine kinase